MKKLTLIFTVAFVITHLVAQEIPVSQQVQKRNAVMEEYTGINCPQCPDGHRIANTIYKNNYGKVVLVNIHEGGYANPAPGQPDLRTTFGAGLANQTSLGGYPAATVNRQIFSFSNTMAMSRSNWTTAVNQVIAQDAKTNLGIRAEIDVQSRLLTVDVEYYNTASTSNPSGKNRLTVMLLQDNIIGPQAISSDATPDPDLMLPGGKYIHSHVLRHILSSGVTPNAFGEEILGAILANDIKTYSYVLPESIRNIPLVLSDLKIVAIVAESTKDIITGHEVKPVFTNFPAVHNSKVINVWTEDSPLCGFTALPVLRIQNFGSSALTSLLIDYSVNGSPVKTFNWTGDLAPIFETEITLNNINFFPQSNNTLSVSTRLPNENADGDPSNDETSFDFELAPDVSGTIYLNLQLDQYGTEVTWELVNSTDVVLYQGGPYTNMNNHPPVKDTFNLASGECYKLKVYDSYGDGIEGNNNGFTLVDDEGYALLSNFRNYGSGDKISFGVEQPQPDSMDVISVANVLITERILVYPNPASTLINISFPLSQQRQMSAYLTNTLGQTVVNISENQTPGNILQLNTSGLPAGIYFLNVMVDGKRYSEKLAVSH